MNQLARNPWIKWDGGECPVEEGTLVNVEFRYGEVMYELDACLLSWRHHYRANDDIMKYQIHTSGEVILTDKIQKNKISITWDNDTVKVSCPSPYSVDGSGFISVQDTNVYHALSKLFDMIEHNET